MLNVLRDLLPGDKPWSIGAVAGVFALLSFMFQALPVGAMLDLDGNRAFLVLFAVPALAALVAGAVAYAHNRRLSELGRPERE